MRPLSATEAISPAIERAKAVLRPFSIKLWVKLGLVAFIAEMSGQFLVPTIPHVPHHAVDSTSGIGAISGGIGFVLVSIFSLIFFTIGLLLLYFGSRMQLVLMDLVATCTNLVAPAWRRTAPRIWRWIGIKVASFLALFAVIGAIAAFPIILFIRHLPTHGAKPAAGAAFGSIALLFVGLIALVFILMLAIWSLRDFVLPFLLFDDASFNGAFRSAIEVIRREPGPVFFYFFMKMVLAILVGIAAELAIALALFVAALPLGLIGGGLWLALRHAGPAGMAIMYISFALLCAVFAVACIIIIFCIAAAVMIFNQAYALYFLGGRYPRLGAILEPMPPQFEQFPPPPHFPPPLPPAPAF